MRVLADENLPRSIVDLLRAEGHDVLWARTDCSGWKDAAILEFAESEARFVLTRDKDFLQVAVQGQPPLRRCGVVLFRVHPATPAMLEPLARMFMAATEPGAGHARIVTAGGIQIVPPQTNPGGERIK